MIGAVSPEWRPLLRVCFLDAGGAIQEIECWLDTGFDGGLLLPRANVTALGLSEAYDITALLADGSSVETKLYPAMILWDGERRRVQVIEAEGQPLSGPAIKVRRNGSAAVLGSAVKVASSLRDEKERVTE